MRGVDISVLLISGSLGIFLAVYTASTRRAPGSKALSALILGAAVWALGYAFEILAATVTYKIFWEKVEWFGIVTIPLAWFTFVAQYLRYPSWMKQILKYKLLLGIIPLITLILVWTNDFHHLVWSSVDLERIGPFETLNYARGPSFWVFMVFSYLLLITGSVMLTLGTFRMVNVRRGQVFLTSLAIWLPWIGNLLYITGLSSRDLLDWNAFLFLISGVALSVSLFHYQLINILPIAQKNVFAGLSDSVFVLDTNNGIVDLNPSAMRMNNLNPDDVLGRNIFQVMPELENSFNQVGDAKEYNAELVRDENTEVQYYDLHISSLTDPHENRIGRVVMLHPITQFKRYQSELERARDQLEATVSERTAELQRVIDLLQKELMQRALAEKRFEDMIESAPDAMFVLDQTGKILLANAMAEEMFGYTCDELMGVDIAARFVPLRQNGNQPGFLHKFLENLDRSQSTSRMELSALRHDGSEFPSEVELSRLNSTSGFWVAINIRDISERKRNEAALRESERTYRALFENAGDAIILIDLEGKIRKVNQKAAELFEFSQDELQELNMFDIIYPEEKSDIQKKLGALIEGSELATHHQHFVRRSGETLHTENNAVLVRDFQGSPKFFQVIARDITERVKAEQAQIKLMEEIRQSNEQMRSLARRLQSVQELERKELATQLHDRVGQNLTGLNLNLKILQNKLQTDSDSEIEKRLNDSLAMVEQTTQMIRGVMADLDPPILDEFGLVPAIKWYSSEFTNRTGIITQLSGAKFEPRLAPGVERIVFRLIQESLNNVAKHAKASRAVINIKSTRDMISVMVKDNGEGFDPKAVKQPTQEPHWGLLSMQQRAASIGAVLEVESSPGNGTQVCIMIRRDQHDN